VRGSLPHLAAAAGAPTTPLAAGARAAITARGQPSASSAGRNCRLVNRIRRMPVASGGGHGGGVAACPPPGLNLVAKLDPRTAAQPCCGCSPLALFSTACRSSPRFVFSLLTVIVVVVSLWLSLSSSCCFLYFPPFFSAFTAPETASFPPQRAKWGLLSLKLACSTRKRIIVCGFDQFALIVH
jgi:hypothetical protein